MVCTPLTFIVVYASASSLLHISGARLYGQLQDLTGTYEHRKGRAIDGKLYAIV